MTIEEITNKLSTQKIKMAQIDPFSYCNAKCWFCPVRYTPNPKEAIRHMPLEVFEKVIADIDSEKKNNGVVDPEFNFIYTAHYNEILLYKYFEEMIEVLRKYNIKTYVLTNGIPLTPEKTDIIKKNLDIIVGICLNVPAFEKEIWSKRSGMSINLFDKLISNIKYAEEQLHSLAKNNMLSLQINSATSNSFWEKGGWLTKEENFPQDLDLNPTTGELATQLQICKQLFPSINIYPMPSLIDRAGLLDTAKIISNKTAITNRLKKQSQLVTGCGNGREVGGRPFGWLHVNARGDAFLCCNDYNFDYVFGNLESNSLKEIWVTEQHAKIIQKSFQEICVNCASSTWN
jgi:MoaA/NifB/PqqE/SkfB family radical SAM enzyme